VLPKRSLIRLVRKPDGVFVDATGKSAGRGAYLHDQLSCWEKGLKGAIAHALRTQLTPEDRQRLSEHMASLPDETPLPEANHEI
jgi:uncharacterized protein